MRQPKKGDRLIYTGTYNPDVTEDAKYPPGTVVGFREHRTKVTVLLDKRDGQVGDLYADWPITDTDPAPPTQAEVDAALAWADRIIERIEEGEREAEGKARNT